MQSSSLSQLLLACRLSITLVCFLVQCFTHMHHLSNWMLLKCMKISRKGLSGRSSDLLEGTELWKAEHARGGWAGRWEPASGPALRWLPPRLDSLPEHSLLIGSSCFGVKRQMVSSCQIHVTRGTLGPSRVQLVLPPAVFSGLQSAQEKEGALGVWVEPGGPSLTVRVYPSPVDLRRRPPSPTQASERPQRASRSKAVVMSFLEAWKQLPRSPTQPGGREGGAITV